MSYFRFLCGKGFLHSLLRRLAYSYFSRKICSVLASEMRLRVLVPERKICTVIYLLFMIISSTENKIKPLLQLMLERELLINLFSHKMWTYFNEKLTNPYFFRTKILVRRFCQIFLHRIRSSFITALRKCSFGT